MAAEPFILPLQKKKEETKSTEEKAGKKNVGAKKKLEKVSRKVTFHKVTPLPLPHSCSSTMVSATPL
jgi:hypothetical protein